ncbi:MAG: hypothetical protein FJ102_18970 [Deltaproteobacteria bacterium]|nr:hypothetical protein [Deltaproteobacteria bacterium]
MLLALAAIASAGSWDFENSLALSWFPRGLRYAFAAEYQVPASWSNPDSVLFDPAMLGAGPYVELTPAYARAGGRVHFVPIAVLDISAEALATGYFGTFTGVTDFDTPDADFSEAAFETEAVMARNHAGFGFRYGVTPTLQAKVSKFILAMPQEFTRFTMIVPEGATGDYWYEPQYDALMKWDDTLMVNSGLAFWAFREKSDEDPRMFWAGVRFDHQYVFGTGDRQLKLGPMVVFKPGKSPAVPVCVLFAQAWLQSPIHEVVPPYLAGAAIW